MVGVSNMDGGISFVFSRMCAIESWHCIYNTHLAFSLVSMRYGRHLFDWNMKCKHSVCLTGTCVDAKRRE